MTLTKLAARIATAFTRNNRITSGEVSSMITSIGSTLHEIQNPKLTLAAVQAQRGQRGVPVEQYTRDGKFVATFPSQTIAAEKTGLRRQSIVANLSGRVPHVGGYVFKRLA